MNYGIFIMNNKPAKDLYRPNLNTQESCFILFNFIYLLEYSWIPTYCTYLPL